MKCDIKLECLYKELKEQRDNAEQHRIMSVMKHDWEALKYWRGIIDDINADMSDVLKLIANQ